MVEGCRACAVFARFVGVAVVATVCEEVGGGRFFDGVATLVWDTFEDGYRRSLYLLYFSPAFRQPVPPATAR